MPAVLYGCETWFVILREVHWLKVLESRVLRKIFWPKSEGTNKRLENMILGGVSQSVLLIRCPRDQMRKMRWAEHVAYLWEEGSAYRALGENLEEGDHEEELNLRWKVNIKRNLKEIGGSAWNGLI